MSKPVKLYPIRGRWLQGVPTAVQMIATKSEAEDLIASGAFTDNPNDAERDHDAVDLSGDPVHVEAGQPVEAGAHEPEPE